MAMSNWIGQIGRFSPRLNRVIQFRYSINLALGGGSIRVFGGLSRGSIFTTRVKNECSGGSPSSPQASQVRWMWSKRKKAVLPLDPGFVLGYPLMSRNLFGFSSPLNYCSQKGDK